MEVSEDFSDKIRCFHLFNQFLAWILLWNCNKNFSSIVESIKNKDKYSGASVHKVTEKLDSGKIIFQKKVKILKKDTLTSLEKKVLKIEHLIYPKAIIKFLTSL